MSMEKLKSLEANVQNKNLCGLYLRNGDKQKLYNICMKYDIPITYPDLFKDDTHYYL